MKKLLFIGLTLLASVSCRQEKEDVQPKYEDWYALRVPVANSVVEAAYGDIDGIVIIATTFNVFLTDDQGNTWRESRYDLPVNSGITGIISVGDTLLLLGGGDFSDSVKYATNPFYFSTDRGESWKRLGPLHGRRDKVPLNILTTPSATYRIKEKPTPIGTGSSTAYYLETEGISSSDGRLLKLPQRQQTRSIYLDNKQRIYVSGSAPVCGASPERFEFCDNGGGILYVSKQPLS